MVKSEKLYSPQSYLEAVTGNYYCITEDNYLVFIQRTLEQNNFELWDYPMSEIDHIVENELNVVLVECPIWNKKTEEVEYVYRWFEVPEDFEEENCDEN